MNLKNIIIFALFSSLYSSITIPQKNLVLLGPPGAGKGTFAQALCAQDNTYEHICIGDLLRAEVRQQTELGKQIEALIAQGTLIDIRITATLVSKKIKDIFARKKLFILDGFPRSFQCLVHFKEIVASLPTCDAPLCLCLELDTESCLERISQRYVCTMCDHVFHKELDDIANDAAVCPHCSVPLSRRANDNAETARKRLADYHATIAPMIESMKKEFPYIIINNSGPRDALHQAINTAISQ